MEYGIRKRVDKIHRELQEIRQSQYLPLVASRQGIDTPRRDALKQFVAAEDENGRDLVSDDWTVATAQFSEERFRRYNAEKDRQMLLRAQRG